MIEHQTIDRHYHSRHELGKKQASNPIDDDLRSLKVKKSTMQIDNVASERLNKGKGKMTAQTTER